MGGVVKEREEESENERRSVRDITGWGLIDSGERIFRGAASVPHSPTQRDLSTSIFTYS